MAYEPPTISNIGQLFPPCAKFTPSDLPDQTGKVHIVTGGSSGVGFELVKVLYCKNATVYVAARKGSKLDNTVKSLREACPQSHGRIEPMAIDLGDLPTVRAAAEMFLAKEARLDVLIHNAGVMRTPTGSVSAQVSKQASKLLNPGTYHCSLI